MILLLPVLIAVSVLAPSSASAAERPLPGESTCIEAGSCEVPPDPGCYEGPNGECVPPWCDPARALSDCPVEPPPPICEDGADWCIPPMPPWCDEAGNCEPPPRPPICEEGVETTGDCIELPPECWVEGVSGAIECVPPWCDPARALSDCPSEPPPPPLCDENSGPEDFCVPPRCDPSLGSLPCVYPPHQCWMDEEGMEPIACLALLTPGSPDKAEQEEALWKRKEMIRKAKARAKAKKAKAKAKAKKAKAKARR